MNRKIQIGGMYRHFKGFVVHVLELAKHTETGEKLVIYISVGVGGNVYARPIDMFLSEADHNKYPNVKQKYRFELIEEHKDNA